MVALEVVVDVVEVETVITIAVVEVIFVVITSVVEVVTIPFEVAEELMARLEDDVIGTTV